MYKIRILLLLGLFCCKAVLAQDILPFTENFSKSNYSGDNQVWSVTQGQDNAMYFANNHYLLRYNGVRWEKYLLPNKTIIRSVLADGARIYCGSYKEFGYWERKNGRMIYYSISKGQKLFSGISENEEVWKIFKVGSSIYFQSFNELYEWDGKRIKKSRFPFQVSYCYAIDNTIYAATVSNGIYVRGGAGFQPLDHWSQLRQNVIHGMEKVNNKIMVFTKYNGVFVGNDTHLEPWTHEVNGQLKDNVILSARLISDTKLAVGTALSGIYIVDLANNSHININRANTLRNNAVLAIATDSENDLWLGLDNGIAHVEVNSPVSLFTDNTGVLGSVYALAVTPDNILLGSNHGLFDYRQKTITPVPSSQGQVWDIAEMGRKYIVGHNEGTFSLAPNRSYKKISNVNGGWSFIYSRFDNVYLQATYSGIAVYHDVNDLSKYKVFKNFTKPIKYIAQARPGEVWAADNYKGLYRIEYDSSFAVTHIENVSQKSNITSDYGVRIFNYNKDILFFIGQRWYHYDYHTSRLQPDAYFNKEFSGISDVINIDEKGFLVVKGGLLHYITRVSDSFQWELIPEKFYEGRLLSDYTKGLMSGNRLYVNLDDGFLTFQPKSARRRGNVLIEAFSGSRLLASGDRVDHNTSVEVNVISAFYGYGRPELFYAIEGKGVVSRIKDGRFTLNNLNSGEYNIVVFSGSGKEMKRINSFRLMVKQPWYFSWWMIMLYILSAAGIFFLYYRWNKVRYNEQIRLNNEELRHKKQILQLEMEAENKLRQQEHEKHILEIEVQSKASEVAGKSLSIAKHSEMIESIQQVLESETVADQIKQRIRKIIKVSTLSRNEWQSFERNLIKSHEEFVARLTARYPSLTPKDIKLCIYLRMNLSSKEIAPLMNISFRGVELHRYRLRKKLSIAQEDNLARFMLSI